MAKELDRVYNPHGLEQKWYPIWEREGDFDYRKNTGKSDSELQPEDCFSIVIPPPNVTGSLHLGHALNHTLQDILIRHQRMLGKAALWVPGTDHAGIATQNVVERLLAEEGLRREDLGRERFEERVWQWKNTSGGMITHQMRQLGESVFWEMERFTLDEGLSHIVRRVFVELYREGLIYRGWRMINWCPKDRTALSNIEVEHKEIAGQLYYVRYPLENASHEGRPYLVVATTRPETILGDEALAVHPDDERYRHLVGARAKVPFIHKSIPVIADAAVARDFGTGVVKITPAHDFQDFAIGQRHHLPQTNIFTETAHLNENGGPYAGLSREECRRRIVADLEAAGLLEKIEPHRHSVGHSYRSGAVVEPRLSLQWFVRVRPLAEKAVEAVRSGATEFYPKRWENLFFDWMEKIEDWCISRQLWWGHQIPAWYCSDCQGITVAVTDPNSCAHCGSPKLQRDPDVLDTWFSSALWPFSTLLPKEVAKIDALWPEGATPQSPLLRNFYPTSVLVTGFDIIFFWVSRMLMMGMHFMQQTPFRKVLIHSLVRDAQRQKMSKSKGNVVNPLEKMEEYGTDAFRFFLISIMPDGKDIIYDESRLKGYQAFCNKVWNTARFILLNTPDGYQLPEKPPTLSAVDHYVFLELDVAVRRCDAALAGFHFLDYANTIYDFLWKTFCDEYIELSKIALKDPALREGALFTLHAVFYSALRLLHPAMPFITEELNSYFATDPAKRIIVARWPQPGEWLNPDPEAHARVEQLLAIAAKIRQVRSELSVDPGARVACWLVLEDTAQEAFLRKHTAFLQSLARLSSVSFEKPATKAIHTPLSTSTSIYLDLVGVVDIARERQRLEKELANLERGYGIAEAKLANPQFSERAPAEVVEAERQKLTDYRTRLDRVRAMLSSLTGS
ncbi:MAG: valine--tRNA ligase [Turneriella sp.]|nr:valine--tRNA ligase [Turneriella sp.]